MPLAAQQKQQTRQRIIDSARRLFNRHGFDAVTIERIMAEAQLTRGGFYKHFAAKEELYEIAVRQFGQSPVPAAWQARHVDPAARERALARMIVSAYLSQDHLDDRDGACPMIALPSDVARSGIGVKQAFGDILEMMVEAFEANLEGDAETRRERALTMAAACVGGMVLARAMPDPVRGDELRAGVRRTVFALAGWAPDDPTPARPTSRSA